MDFELTVDEQGAATPLVEVPRTSDRHPDRRGDPLPSGPGVVSINLRAIPMWRTRIVLRLQTEAELTKLMQDLGIAEPADGMLHVDIVDRLEIELQRRRRVAAGMFG